MYKVCIKKLFSHITFQQVLIISECVILYRKILLQVLSFVFLTDRENITLSRFSGTFSFISDEPYKLGAVDTTAGRDAMCNFIIRSSKLSTNSDSGGGYGGRKDSKEGRILTPTYPGTYPKNLKCSYKFIGKTVVILIPKIKKLHRDECG